MPAYSEKATLSVCRHTGTQECCALKNRRSSHRLKSRFSFRFDCEARVGEKIPPETNLVRLVRSFSETSDCFSDRRLEIRRFASSSEFSCSLRRVCRYTG